MGSPAVSLASVAKILDNLPAVGCSGRPESIQSRYYLVQDLFDLAGRRIRDSRILDCGCGRGIMSCVLACMEASEVQGLDPDEECLASFRSYREMLPDRLARRLQITKGDAMKMPYESVVMPGSPAPRNDENGRPFPVSPKGRVWTPTGVL
jgi:hypothetical protein